MTDRPDPLAPRGRPRRVKKPPQERYDPFLPRPAVTPPPEPEPEPVVEPEPVSRKPEPLWSGDDARFHEPLPTPQIPGAEDQAKQKAKRVGGPLGVLLVAFWQVGRVVLVFIGKIAILFKIPLLGSVISGLISVGAYALFFGWPFAIGLVGSLLVHELGHVVAIKRERMPVKALNFVPFLGAYVMSDRARTADQQARISIAGPIAGTLCALAIFYAVPNAPQWRAVAYTGFFLNLVNLLPVPGLDGGGVGRVFPASWWLGITGCLVAVWAASGEEYAVIAAVGAAVMVYSRRSAGWALQPADGVPVEQRVLAAVLYVGVIAVCAFGMSATFVNRTNDLVNGYGFVPHAVMSLLA